MKMDRMCAAWDRILEVPLLTNGTDVTNNMPLKVNDCLDIDVDWETYKCSDILDKGLSVVVKIYRDAIDTINNPNIRMGFKVGSYEQVDTEEIPLSCFAFEVLEGDYELATHPYRCKETKKEEEEEDEDNPLKLCIDEDTGEEYVLNTSTFQIFYEQSSCRNADKAKDDEKKAVEATGPKGFACVAGMRDLKKQLEREVLFPIQNRDVMELYKLHPLNGMLLHGHPGCGKTFIAEKFAEESGMNFEMVSSGSLSGKYIHETANSIREMFERARKKSPCVLCIDEIDAVCPRRSEMEGGGGADWTESVNEFLTQMNNCSKDGIFIVGTTNNPQLIDEALLRTGRMDKVISIPMPDGECRKEMIEMYLKDRPQDKDIDTAALAEMTDGMTASDIEFMVNSVAMEAAYTLSNITFEDLAKQAKSQRRSGDKVAKTTLKKVETNLHRNGVPRIVGFSKVS